MQTLNPSEISELIKSRIEKVKLTAEARNEGTVTSVSDGIVLCRSGSLRTPPNRLPVHRRVFAGPPLAVTSSCDDE